MLTTALLGTDPHTSLFSPAQAELQESHSEGQTALHAQLSSAQAAAAEADARAKESAEEAEMAASVIAGLEERICKLAESLGAFACGQEQGT